MVVGDMDMVVSLYVDVFSANALPPKRPALESLRKSTRGEVSTES